MHNATGLQDVDFNPCGRRTNVKTSPLTTSPPPG